MTKSSRTVFRNNFGAIRYILAIAIFISHFNVITGSSIPFPISGYFRVCSFFVMSGFLIYGSYFRSTDWKDYLKNRAWRILPSYIITVLGCAIALSLISEYSFHEYVSSKHLIKYVISNIISLNFLEPTLPGVFENNNLQAVNGSLWTMKVEWMLYLFIIPVIWFTKKSGLHFWKIFIMILVASIIYKMTFTHLYDVTGKNIYSILAKQIGGQLAFFYSGVFLYTYFDRLKKYKIVIAILSFVILFCGVTWFPQYKLFSHLLFPLSLAGFVVAIAFIGKWGIWAETFENCTYEIYLFHFPIIQTAQHFNFINRYGVTITFCIVFSITMLLSYIVAKYISAPLRRSHRSAKRTENANVFVSSGG